MLIRLTTSLAALALMTTAALATDIVDEGKFFSPEAVTAANKSLGELEQKYRHPIHIETYASPPGKFAGGANRDAMYESWIKDRAAQTNARGLFVLISKEPAHVHAAAGRSLVQAGFTPAARQRVVNAFLTSFHANKFDEGLSAAISQINDEFSGMSKSIRIQDRGAVAAPVGRVAQHPQQGGGFSGWLAIGLLIVGGLFLLSLLGRAFNGGAGQAYGAPGMGGGFGSGLFGGLLGAFAGNWLYNSFAGSHHGQAFGQEHTAATHGDSGSDFGAGADFGGGDFGGGDFGGGDFSGGGDF